MIVCLIQARLKSTRLQDKAMLKIAGEPMASYTVKAAQLSKKIDLTGLISPDTKEDKEAFYSYFKDKCYTFYGDENNVLKRYYDAVKDIEVNYEKVTHIIRLTSDCPLHAYNNGLIDKIIKYHIDNGYDFTHNKGKFSYPSGLDVEIMTRETLEKSYTNAEAKDEKEHVTLYVKNNENDFNIGEYNLPEKQNILSSNRHWSVDTKEDMDKIKEFIELLSIINGDVFDGES